MTKQIPLKRALSSSTIDLQESLFVNMILCRYSTYIARHLLVLYDGIQTDDLSLMRFQQHFPDPRTMTATTWTKSASDWWRLIRHPARIRLKISWKWDAWNLVTDAKTRLVIQPWPKSREIKYMIQFYKWVCYLCPSGVGYHDITQSRITTDTHGLSNAKIPTIQVWFCS